MFGQRDFCPRLGTWEVSLETCASCSQAAHTRNKRRQGKIEKERYEKKERKKEERKREPERESWRNQVSLKA